MSLRHSLGGQIMPTSCKTTLIGCCAKERHSGDMKSVYCLCNIITFMIVLQTGNVHDYLADW